MNRKDVRRILKTSCAGVLRDLLNDVGFSDAERVIFYNRYVLSNPHSVPMVCLMVPCSPSTFNDIHNRVLDKVLSYLQYKGAE
jgi:hypothetical protein